MFTAKKSKINIAVSTILIASALLVGYAAGTRHPQTIVIKGVNNIENGVVTNQDFTVFWDTWRTIQNTYLRAAEVKNQNLIYGAASGLVGALKDPYSTFMNPSDAKKFSEDINGNFGGIGAEIALKNDQLIIVAPLKNSPAERAGLLAGDKILEINATSTMGIVINDAVKLIRGPKGTTVSFMIGRSTKDKPLTITVIRDTINVPVVEWKMKEGNIAHVQLFTFSEKAPRLILQALGELQEQNAQGIILDMRNNPGGYLEAAVDIAGYFLKPGDTIIYEEFKNGKRDEFKARGNRLNPMIPMIIMLNNGSASASEILAGALKDNLNIKIVGEKSFGKGTVQELNTLRDGSEVKLTIAHWILPKGAQIDKNGIKPDHEVKITDDDREKKRDPQLEKALELLKSEMVKTQSR